MLKNFVAAEYVMIAVLLVPFYAFGQQVAKTNDYRIEESEGKDAKGSYCKTIKFISPKGKTIKTVTKSRKDVKGLHNIVSPTADYLIKAEELPGKAFHGKANLRLSMINAMAKAVWSKDYEIAYPRASMDETDLPPYKIFISRDGTRIVFVRLKGYPNEVHHEIVVWDQKGNDIASVQNVPEILDGHLVKVAPDGKIVSAELTDGRLFFLDIETEKVKTVNREGIINGNRWSASAFPLENKKIHFCGGWHHIDSSQTAFSSFDELPDDLSTLFDKEGKPEYRIPDPNHESKNNK